MKSPLVCMQEFIHRHPKLVVITGAGISTQSGIPSYRNASGTWQRREAIQHQDFLSQSLTRQRYWARSILGWEVVAKAQPNPSHRHLAQWEADGRIIQLVTQNVDGLHRAAGSNNVLELHGRLDRVRCLTCHSYSDRSVIQTQLIQLNPALWHYAQNHHHQAGPDGDAAIDDWPSTDTVCPLCPKCRGTIMPDVVFYGGTVPKARVELVYRNLEQADALLIIGSSLMVFSAYRFCKQAKHIGLPLAVINQGFTRADNLLDCKLEMDCAEALAQL